MNCRKCGASETRVTVTQHKNDETWRYCRCLKCGERFKTVEVYAVKKPGPPPGRRHARAFNLPRGVDHGGSVLVEENIHEIRRLARGGITYEQIAKTFGVSRAYVGKICAYKAWAHLTTPDERVG